MLSKIRAYQLLEANNHVEPSHRMMYSTLVVQFHAGVFKEGERAAEVAKRLLPTWLHFAAVWDEPYTVNPHHVRSLVDFAEQVLIPSLEPEFVGGGAQDILAFNQMTMHVGYDGEPCIDHKPSSFIMRMERAWHSLRVGSYSHGQVLEQCIRGLPDVLQYEVSRDQSRYFDRVTQTLNMRALADVADMHFDNAVDEVRRGNAGRVYDKETSSTRIPLLAPSTRTRRTPAVSAPTPVAHAQSSQRASSPPGTSPPVVVAGPPAFLARACDYPGHRGHTIGQCRRYAQAQQLGQLKPGQSIASTAAQPPPIAVVTPAAAASAPRPPAQHANEVPACPAGEKGGGMGFVSSVASRVTNGQTARSAAA